jgi:hypothetical protein
MSLLKNTPHPALKYSVFKVKNFLQLAQFYAHAHVDGKGAGGERGGLLRFPLTKPHKCHAACGPASCPAQLQIYALCDSTGGNCGRRWGGGAGAQVGGRIYAGLHTFAR